MNAGFFLGLWALGAAAAAEPPQLNGLAGQKSPYLASRAQDPVYWRPWGSEAFELARAGSKPIFLSIGFSACHWCHVMGRESFSDPGIAALINRDFIAIKVDREERPDLDLLYLEAAELAGWGGGWPLTLWLTPELKPFYGGTYFPPRTMDGRPGLREVLAEVSALWERKRPEAVRDSERLAAALQGRFAQRAPPRAPRAETLDQAYQSFRESFDPDHGGFSPAPKFPLPPIQSFLLRYHARRGKAEALTLVSETLKKIARGGIHDQLAGGFHRYASDERWRSPHFEKMLYDNALLAVNFLEASQASGDAELAAIARSTLDYLLTELQRPGGGFFSSQDAESLSGDAAREGAYYLWRREQAAPLLEASLRDVFLEHYGIGETDSVPFVARGIEESARLLGLSRDDASAALSEGLRRLRAARDLRPRPAVDGKVLAGWNGLAISAFARAGRALNEPRYLEAAQAAARFLREHLYDPSSRRLFRVWNDGRGAAPGLAEDYLFTAAGLLDLYEADLDETWLRLAEALCRQAIELFYDRADGGFYIAAAPDELIARPRTDSDGPIPSADAAAALTFLRLDAIAPRPELAAAARATLARFARPMAERPLTLPAMLSALDFAAAPTVRIAISGDRRSEAVAALLREAHRAPLYNRVILGKPETARAAAYVCRGQTCDLPVSDPEALRRLLKKARLSTRSR